MKENKAPRLCLHIRMSSPATASLNQMQGQRGIPEQWGLAQVWRR